MIKTQVKKDLFAKQILLKIGNVVGRICMPTLGQQNRYITSYIYLLYRILRVDLKVRNTSGALPKTTTQNYGELLTFNIAV